MYVCMCVCVCMYIYIYIYLHAYMMYTSRYVGNILVGQTAVGRAAALGSPIFITSKDNNIYKQHKPIISLSLSFHIYIYI